MIPIVVFIGVAGSGKSSQGRLLSDTLGYHWLSTGELLRQRISGEVRRTMVQGRLLDDEEMIKLIDHILDGLPSAAPCVLDGFPRTLKQAEWLIAQSKAGRLQIVSVIHLLARPEIVLERLLKRGRPDDNDEAIRHRFAEYEQITIPIIQRFRAENITTHEIDGQMAVGDVQLAILKALQVNT